MTIDSLRLKYLKNNTNTMISTSNGVLIPPGDIIGLNRDTYDSFKNDLRVVKAIKKGQLLVGTDGQSFYTNPVEGTLIFENEFDDGGQIIYSNNLIPLTPSIRLDKDTGVKGTSLALSLFQILKDFYNDPLNPLYSGPHETVYWDNVPRLKETVMYFEDKIKSLTYLTPNLFTFYNGQPADELLKYNGIMFAEPNPALVSELKSKNQFILVACMASATLSQSAFETRVNLCQDVDCIYMTNSGYGKGTVDTNGRVGFNNKVNYIHSIGKHCVVDCLNTNHVFGTINDPLYPNSVWNKTLSSTSLGLGDKYVINDFATSSTGFNDLEVLLDKMNILFGIRDTYDIDLVGMGYIDNNDPDKQEKYNAITYAALLFGLDGLGLGMNSTYYRPTNDEHLMFWTRVPDIFIEDGYLKRYTFDRRLITVDLSSSYNSKIEEF